MVTHQKEVYYRLRIWHLDLTHKTKTRPDDNLYGWSPTIPRMVTHHPKDGHPTGRKDTTDSEFGTYLDSAHKTKTR